MKESVKKPTLCRTLPMIYHSNVFLGLFLRLFLRALPMFTLVYSHSPDMKVRKINESKLPVCGKVQMFFFPFVLVLCWTEIDQGSSLPLPVNVDVSSIRLWHDTPNVNQITVTLLAPKKPEMLCSLLLAQTTVKETCCRMIWFRNMREKWVFVHILFTDVQVNTKPSHKGAAKKKTVWWLSFVRGWNTCVT